MQRQGILSAKEAQFSMWSCVKRISGHWQPRHLLVYCNEFLICPLEKSKWQNWISKSVFAMCYYSSMCWASFRCPLAFFCFCLCHGEAVDFIISSSMYCLSESVIFSRSTKPGSLVCPLGSVHQQILYPVTLLQSLCFGHRPLLSLWCKLCSFLKSSFVISLLGSQWLIIVSKT